jgi:hypothetical protein
MSLCPFWFEVPPRAQPRFEIANLSNGKRNARQNVQSHAIGTNLMAGQPSAPEDHAATLLPAEPRSHDTVFMACVQRRFRSWELMVRSRVSAPSRTMRPGCPFPGLILRDAAKAPLLRMRG